MGDQGSNRQLARRVAIMAAALVVVAAAASAQEVSAPGDELVRLEGLYALGLHGNALEGVDELLARDALDAPSRVRALVLRGRCYVQLGREVAGREAFVSALELDPDWQPDPQLFTDRELGVFNEAKQELAAREPPPVTVLPEPRTCPSTTAPLIATGAFAGTLIWYFSAKSTADDRWREYEADPGHAPDLYQSYEDAQDRQQLAGYVSIGTGVVTGYLWWRYFSRRRGCGEETAATGRSGLIVTPRAVAVSYRF